MTSDEEAQVHGHEVQLRLPFATASAPAARRELVADLQTAGYPEPLINDAALVVTELVTNGVLHGQPDASGGLAVSWTGHPDRVVIVVCDGGGVDTLAPLPLTTTESHGRGLAIVDYITDSWQVDPTRGTRITAELRVPRPR
ncbi:ATP-binding protein [Nocardioides ferulae]|uniref:ATP-binding protein n=1 Tax=Nocardioides ferulae TaxID=2340821 RepID=UPI0013DE42FF|nr:ATP-binding protein [Nocardioides ferulae]